MGMQYEAYTLQSYMVPVEIHLSGLSDHPYR